MPITTPACVAAAVIVGEDVMSGDDPSPVSAFARPKSSTLTCPPGVSFTLAGFRSRWTIPFSCAASSARAICRAIASASSSGIGPARDPLRERLAFDELEHQRLEAVRLLEPVDRRDVRVVERRQHLRLALEPRQALGILRQPSGSTLIATSRSSFASRARYTSPIPPAPSGDRIS